MKNYLLQNENAIYYECGFSCDNVIFLKLGSERFFITDVRYTLEAQEAIHNNTQVIQSSDLVTSCKKILSRYNIKKLTVDPYDLSHARFLQLTQGLKTQLIFKENFSKLKRMIKTDWEVELLSEAIHLGEEAFDHFSQFLCKKGESKTEQELFFKAQQYLSYKGRFDLSFNPIVAINENAAKPHALPTSKRLEKNNLLLIDAGLKYQRYCSDRTATASLTKDGIHFKRNQTFKKKKHQKIYDLVYQAQQTAIEKARVGMKASQIDQLARDIIEKAGYGKFFKHSTGHGIGLDIHEYPMISPKSDTIIEDNMVFTIEPGIYLPNEFGVRIEDCVVMKNSKASVL